MKQTFLITAIVVMIFFLAVPLVSAAEFDNWVTYEEDNDKVAIIENVFTLGRDLARIELLTPRVNHVSAGENVSVMVFKIDNYEDLYIEAIGEMKIENLNTGKTEVKSYHYDSAIYGDVLKYDKECKKVLDKNGTIYNDCNAIVVGTEKKIIGWERFNAKDLTKGNVTLALVVDVEEGDRYDGIPYLFGKPISRWAVWDTGLSTNLTAYWTLNESAGTDAEDLYNGHNLVMNGTRWKPGQIGNGFEPNGTGHTNTQIDTASYDNMTITFWMNLTHQTNWITNKRLISTRDVVYDNGQFFIGSDGGGSTLAIGAKDSGGAESAGFTPDDFEVDVKIGLKKWGFYAITFNSTQMHLYVNGTHYSYWNFANPFIFSSDDLFFFGQPSGGIRNISGVNIDEIGIWNRTLSPSEINQLYNDGAGITYNPGAPPSSGSVTTTLDIPLDNYESISKSVTFGCNANHSLSKMNNLTLYKNAQANYTVFNTTARSNLTLSYTINNLDYQTYNWTCVGYAEANPFDWPASNRTFTISRAAVNSQSYNLTTYETAIENFQVNISYDNISYSDISANLIYNGTSYTGAETEEVGGTSLFLASFDEPLVYGPIPSSNGTFYWRYGLTNTSGISYFNTTQASQNVSMINFTHCHSTTNVPYLNLTYVDEETGLNINGTIDASTFYYWLGGAGTVRSFLYTNLSLKSPNNPFCFSPADRIVNTNASVQYSYTGYPQRRYIDNGGVLTNSTTQKVLYLLASGDGIYSTIQVTDTGGAAVVGATVTIERQFVGVWTIVGQDTTDSAGQATFWVNPNYDHRIQVTHPDCTTQTHTIRPTQTAYGISLSCTGISSDVYISTIEGLRYNHYPASGVISPGQYNFSFIVESSKFNLQNIKFRLLNASGAQINSSSLACNSSGGITSILHYVNNGDNIKGLYYIDIGTGDILIEADAYWRSIATNVSSSGTVRNFMLNFRSLFDDWHDPDTDVSNKKEFSRFLFIFLGIAIFMAFFNYRI